MKVQTANALFERGDFSRKVSVIVPLYNYAHFIESTLESVSAQTFKDLALIVIDDASTDNSREVVEQWMASAGQSVPGLKLLANTTNAGLSITRNTGIAHARSEYCFFLDADNMLFTRCIEKHVRALDARSDCIGAYSILEEFGGTSGLISSNVFNRERLKHGNYIDAMAMLRKDAVEALGGFCNIKHGWEDFELWLRVCEAEKRLVHIPEILSRYRHHDRSMLRQQTNVGNNLRDLHRIIEELHPWVQLAPPHPQSPRVAPRSTPVEVGPAISSSAAGRTGNRVSGPVRKRREQPAVAGPYKKYKFAVLEKIGSLSTGRKLPVDVEIDADFTGPIHATQFDAFATSQQREDSIRQTERMLSAGIVAISPRPGVHAARGPNGDFIRYRSIEATLGPITSIPSSMLIHIHAFYSDVVAEMLECFVGDARNSRFLITTTSTKSFAEVQRILDEGEFSAAKNLLIDNRGRDIGPFLDYAIDLAGPSDVLCHVHTKKSPDVGGDYGKKWRRSLYGTLLTQSAVDAFSDPRLGLLFTDNPRCVGWGKNLPICEQIAEQFDRPLRTHPGPMPVGNMFYVRAEVASAMRQATQGINWPREPVPYDGTVLHAIERMWTIACERVSLEWAAIHARQGGARIGYTTE